MSELKSQREIRINRLRELIKNIKSNVDELEMLFKRRFTIDGCLAGSIGEAFAEYYYDIELSKQNNKTYDAVQNDKKIQIKMTQRNSIDIRYEPDYLIVLYISISADEVEAYEVYNGRFRIYNSVKTNSNNERTFQLRKLCEENKGISNNDRIKYRENTSIKKWKEGVSTSEM